MRIPSANRFTVLALVALALVALSAVARPTRPVTVSASQQAAVLRTAPVTVGMRASPSPGSPGSHALRARAGHRAAAPARARPP